MAEVVFIGVGSNISPGHNIERAITKLNELFGVRAVSMFYKTPPEGTVNQPAFYNGVIKLQTSITPRKLKFDYLRRIESDLGRVRTDDKNGPREIDLDILLYGNHIIEEDDLVIPPEDITRPFVILCLDELAGETTLPGTDHKISGLAEKCDRDKMKALPEFTTKLRQHI